MATEAIPSEIIEGQRRKLLEILQQDPDSVLDTLTSRRLISEKEYEALDKVTDPLKKSRKLLILVQKKGEGSCQDFLRCLSSTFPESAAACDFQHGKWNHTLAVKGREQILWKEENYHVLFLFVFLPDITFAEK
jgi:caspase recruitment domain-containing protein 6